MKISKWVLVLGTALATATPAAVYAQATAGAGSPADATTAGAATAEPSAAQTNPAGATPVKASNAETGDDASAIIVTARRVEERLQDVPISITVFNQAQLNNRNVRDATDLATYTPSLQANNNFGQDNTTFAIRGFAQDIGTAPSVGVYFADVVVPRGGSNGEPVGDTANAGDFFDLENVQVLKGPQGTLFGRNTTGGAVLFVPQKPTDKLEGYVMGGYGNYNQRRVQAVLNVPLSDTFRVRLGVDREKQNGYLHNISGIGPRDFNNVDYTAVRLSIVGDLTPNLENYIIASYNKSDSHGGLNKVTVADPSQGLFAPFAAAQIARQNATGDFYAVLNNLPNAGLKTTQWQVIDNLTWKATDNLTFKNIASYAQLKQAGVNPIFGASWQVPVGGVVYNTGFQQASGPPGGDIANESTFTDELRLQGNSSDNKLSYQAGAYLEVVRPLSEVGSQSPGFANCLNGSTSNCTDPFGGLLDEIYGIPAAYQSVAGIHVANVNYTVGETAYHDVGLYAQATYKLSDQFKATGGFRYTWDHESVNSTQTVSSLNAPPVYGILNTTCENSPYETYPNCNTRYFTKSAAPTWLGDLDYTPTRDLLIYGKYSRGYRAAVVVPNIPFGGTLTDPDTTLNYVKPEKVDAFEVGLKSSFAQAVHGTFNVAGFYNNFTNQQLQLGFLPKSNLYPETAAPVNAGKSKIYGAEIEASLRPFRGFDLNFGYTYLRTRIDEVLPLPSNAAYNTQASFNVGDPEVLSPRNKFTVGANYALPTPDGWGRLSVGGSVTYRSSMLSTYIDRSNPDPAIAAAGTLPSLTLVDGNANWVGVFGSPVDLGFFITNILDKHYYNFTAGLGSPQLGFDVQSVGAPRMFGGTLKVHFGS